MVELAKRSGFCFGVRRSVELLDAVLEQHPEGVYTYGEIIHNPQLIESFNRRGVHIINDVSEAVPGSTVVIRAHGAEPSVYEALRARGVNIVDATCTNVSRIHTLAAEKSAEGLPLIIVGSAGHPEVIGILGYCKEAYVVEAREDVLALPHLERAFAVAQTTASKLLWNELYELLRERIPGLTGQCTICSASSERQQAAAELAQKSDIMIVVGGKHSGNTQRLADTCRRYCREVYHIEAAQELNNIAINRKADIGVTAGASTPDWILQEVLSGMSELEGKTVNEEVVQEEEKLQAAAEVVEEVKAEVAEPAPAAEAQEDDEAGQPTMADFEILSLKPGKVVKGTVLSVEDDRVYVNVGYKSDGLITGADLCLEEGAKATDAYTVGQKIEVKVVKVNDGEGNVILTRKVFTRKKSWDELKAAFEAGTEFTVKCTEVVKGGVCARLMGERVFIPASQLSGDYVEDLSTFVDQELRIKLIDYKEERGKMGKRLKLVASQAVILEEEKKAKLDAVWDTLHVGDRVTATVKRITDFGAFAEVGGIDGLIHISDLSWNRIEKPGEVVAVNQELEVEILSVNKEKNRLSLGYKQTMPRPWDNVEEEFAVDSLVKGKVVRITPFGAFIALKPGVDGLIHISQVTNKRIEKVEDVLHIGDEVEAKVLKVSKEKRRISLSIRATMPAPERPERSERRGDRGDREDRGDRAPRRNNPRRENNNGVKYEKEEMKISLADLIPDELKNL